MNVYLNLEDKKGNVVAKKNLHFRLKDKVSQTVQINLGINFGETLAKLMYDSLCQEITPKIMLSLLKEAQENEKARP